MSVKMRLRRMGAKHQPSYRIVIADSRSPRDGRYIDQVGFYNPLTNPATVDLNKEKAIDWLRKGAQPTDTVVHLLRKFEIVPEIVRKPDGTSAPAMTPEVVAATPAKRTVTKRTAKEADTSVPAEDVQP